MLELFNSSLKKMFGLAAFSNVICETGNLETLFKTLL